MAAHNPIGRCCSRPRFNAIGGIDERTWSDSFGVVLHRLRRTLDQQAMRRQNSQVKPVADKAAAKGRRESDDDHTAGRTN
jgi:hypothetical protein